ncbi:S9 family peptidase [Phenylobacterium sp. J367]|uniref:alpha/beta hydrolase family protein n=1 Tax=Phenylobacterium sp. J367 TaxID=2898435 RepID=UPI002151BC22|nr:S9 family peptidase [Phenylobacterium sp. J367]MCR5878102.1 S9 family peptidase [Phenylobacterium sp. J367]
MPAPTRRSALAAALMAPLLGRAGMAWATPAQAPLKPHTLDDLLRAPVVRDAAISPDGRQLAVLRERGGDEHRTAIVMISRLDDLEATPAPVSLGDYEVEQVEWASNDRLLIWVAVREDDKGRPTGVWVSGVLIPMPVRRVISVGVDGRDPIVLFADQKAMLRRAFDAARIVDLMHDDERLVLMQTWDAFRGAFSLYKVDVYSGRAEVVERGPPTTDFWLTQRGVPMLRMDSNRRGTVVSVFARAPGETEWKLIRRSRRDELKKLPDFDVVGATPEPGVFLVSMRDEGEDTKAIRTFDIKTLSFGPVVGDRPAHDMESAVIDENLKLVATSSRADRLDYQFADPNLAAHYKAVNGALKNVANVRLYDISLDHQRLLLKATGPQEPGAFHLYDRDTKRLHLIATTRPWLEPARLARMETFRIRTRDGAELTAYLSVPAGAPDGRPVPMVVLPHGGPEIRDYYDYDLMTQALAARGWLVLQPNFRGSGGYGKAFADAGRRRWGDLMQADVEDAVAEMVALGLADPGRIAICGASYGGYAALQGAVRRPDLYKAVVAIAGVSDLLEMLKDEREDGLDSPSYRYWVRTVGDPNVDAGALRAASPRLQAAHIAAPVLLLHGSDDQVVQPRQSKMMQAALVAAGKPVEFAELPDAGHANWSPETWKLVLTRAGDFIAKSFG